MQQNCRISNLILSLMLLLKETPSTLTSGTLNPIVKPWTLLSDSALFLRQSWTIFISLQDLSRTPVKNVRSPSSRKTVYQMENIAQLLIWMLPIKMMVTTTKSQVEIFFWNIFVNTNLISDSSAHINMTFSSIWNS